MCRGRIEQIGTPDEVRNNPASAFVFHFTSDVNHLPSTCAVRAHPCCCSKIAANRVDDLQEHSKQQSGVSWWIHPACVHEAGRAGMGSH